MRVSEYFCICYNINICLSPSLPLSLARALVNIRYLLLAQNCTSNMETPAGLGSSMEFHIRDGFEKRNNSDPVLIRGTSSMQQVILCIVIYTL